jgi:serine/threonine protein phosphatase PrpC
MVSSDPDVTTIEMDGTEDFMIIGCDGLWDTVSPEGATESVFDSLRENKGQFCALKIIKKNSCVNEWPYC